MPSISHLARVGILSELTVYIASQAQCMWVCELVGRYDPRTNGSVRIERLPDGERRRVELPVACRDIVGHKIPKHVLRRILLRDTLGVTANHGAQLDLVIQFAEAVRSRDAQLTIDLAVGHIRKTTSIIVAAMERAIVG
ncbi:MAG TPA: hypothetical protein VNO35_27185 [Steroidobacteraceae bacterium]|nr:hypothetical protein [Steroidobacteraceae bacterium]